MKRSKMKARGNPFKGVSEGVRPPIVHRDVKPANGESLGFGRDRARAHGTPTPPIGLGTNVSKEQEK